MTTWFSYPGLNYSNNLFADYGRGVAEADQLTDATSVSNLVVQVAYSEFGKQVAGEEGLRMTSYRARVEI
jgi:hypothetical protein